MSREIKFRHWCPESKYMTPFEEIRLLPSDKMLSESLSPDAFNSVLMQFIGLKDKNSKEIYEGDIVKWGMFDGSEEHWHRYAKVEIKPDIRFKIIYYVDSETGERKPTDNYVFKYGRFAYKDTHNHLEIIGNIYENPELLND